MARQIKLISQYNSNSTPLEWSDYFTIFTNKDSYHVAVEYTPDNFINIIRKKELSEVIVNKKIGSYDFNDDSFLNLSNIFVKSNYRILNINWNKEAEDMVREDIDFENIYNFDNLSEILKEAYSLTPNYIQCINEMIIKIGANSKLQLSKYGVVTLIGDTDDEEVREIISKVLL